MIACYILCMGHVVKFRSLMCNDSIVAIMYQYHYITLHYLSWLVLFYDIFPQVGLAAMPTLCPLIPQCLQATGNF